MKKKKITIIVASVLAVAVLVFSGCAQQSIFNDSEIDGDIAYNYDIGFLETDQLEENTILDNEQTQQPQCDLTEEQQAQLKALHEEFFAKKKAIWEKYNFESNYSAISEKKNELNNLGKDDENYESVKAELEELINSFKEKREAMRAEIEVIREEFETAVENANLPVKAFGRGNGAKGRGKLPEHAKGINKKMHMINNQMNKGLDCNNQKNNIMKKSNFVMKKAKNLMKKSRNFFQGECPVE